MPNPTKTQLPRSRVSTCTPWRWTSRWSSCRVAALRRLQLRLGLLQRGVSSQRPSEHSASRSYSVLACSTAWSISCWSSSATTGVADLSIDPYTPYWQHTDHQQRTARTSCWGSGRRAWRARSTAGLPSLVAAATQTEQPRGQTARVGIRALFERQLLPPRACGRFSAASCT